jgi:hypothetical protein
MSVWALFMAITTKKGSSSKKPRQRLLVTNTSVAEQAQTTAELRQELEVRNRDLAESLQRENATAKELQDYKRQFTEALNDRIAGSKMGAVELTPPVEERISEVVRRIVAVGRKMLAASGASVTTRASRFNTSQQRRKPPSCFRPAISRNTGTPIGRSHEPGSEA